MNAMGHGVRGGSFIERKSTIQLVGQTGGSLRYMAPLVKQKPMADYLYMTTSRKPASMIDSTTSPER